MTFEETFQLALPNPLETARFVVEKITDTFLGQDNKIYYRVKWQETWEPEDRLMVLCAPLVNEFWKEYAQVQQRQQQHSVPLPATSLQDTISVNKKHLNQESSHFLTDVAVIPSQNDDQQHQLQSTSQVDTLSAPGLHPCISGTSSHSPNAVVAHQDSTIAEPQFEELQSIADFRLNANFTEKRSAQFFVEPRFLATNSILLQSRIPYTYVQDSQTSDEVMSKMLAKIPEYLNNNNQNCDGNETTKFPHMSTDLLCEKEKRKMYSCDVCQKQFKTKSLLKTHDTVVHPSDSLNCQTCGKAFLKKTALNRHMLSHTSVRPHVCDVCDKGFKERSNLTKHMIIHTGDRPHTCDVCNASFRQLGHLLKHVLVHKPDKPFKCNVCEKGFKRKEHLKDHSIIHTTDFPYKCDICSKKFRFKTNLKVHILQHNDRKDFVCEICHKAFSGKSNLMQHQTVHMSDYNFSCQLCNRKFRRKGHLKRHMDIHKNESFLKCVICKESLPNKQAYRRHMFNHTGSKPFACVMCDNRFTSKSFLTQHMQKHSEDLPFECEHCHKKFRLKTSLDKHVLVHTDVKKFECMKCKRLFRLNMNLQKHIKSCQALENTSNTNELEIFSQHAVSCNPSNLHESTEGDGTKSSVVTKITTNMVTTLPKNVGTNNKFITIDDLLGNHGSISTSTVNHQEVHSVHSMESKPDFVIEKSVNLKSSVKNTENEEQFESLVLPLTITS